MSGSLAAAAIGAAAGAAIAIAATNFTRPAEPQAPPVVVPPTPPRGLPPSAAGNALSVEGQVALVTGGGTGIGREIARVLLAAGASVVITGRRQEVLEDTVASLSAAEAEGRVASVVGDVGQEADAEAMVARAVELFGGLDILVNNAGIVAASGVFADVEAADFDAVIATNLRGTFLVSRAAIRQMREQGRGGAIVNNSSCCGVAAWRNLAAYGASKGGMNMLTKCMAVDHAADGIRVNAIAPGTINTDAGADAAELAAHPLASIYPLGRIGMVEDLGYAVLLLCAPAGAWINGVVMPIDGGLTSYCRM